MRVLMLNRPDAYSAWGGDTTQMEETRRALGLLGVASEVSLASEPAIAPGAFDLAHVFNLQTAPHGLRQLQAAKRAGLPVALSTIYWDLRLMRVPEFFQHHPKGPVRALARLHWRIAAAAVETLKVVDDRRRGAPERTLLREADLLLPNSIAEVEILVRDFDAPWVRGASMVVPNGVDPAAAIDCGARDVVLQVGKIDPVKGQLRVIEALFDRPELPLVFVGRGLETSYGAACLARGLARGNTHFTGELRGRALAAQFGRARVHVLPSLRESPGLATLEAALHGANCVVSTHGPVMEYFGNDAWLCDPMDPAAIRRAILTAWDAPPSALAGRVAAHFTWPHAAAATRSAYRRLLDGETAGAGQGR